MEDVILAGNDVLHQAISCFVDVDVFLKKKGGVKQFGMMRGKKYNSISGNIFIHYSVVSSKTEYMDHTPASGYDDKK